MTEKELAAVEHRAHCASGSGDWNDTRWTVDEDVPALAAEVRRLQGLLAAEREACAKVADVEATKSQRRLREGHGREMDLANAGCATAAEDIAAAIRARQTEGK